LGVERPEELTLPVIRTPKNPEVEADGAISGGVGDADECFNDECLGGEGGRVEEWCMDFVSRWDTDAVAVDVLDDAAGGGERG